MSTTPMTNKKHEWESAFDEKFIEPRTGSKKKRLLIADLGEVKQFLRENLIPKAEVERVLGEIPKEIPAYWETSATRARHFREMSELIVKRIREALDDVRRALQ